MRSFTRRTRNALALAVIATVVPLGAAATADAAPARSADTTTYTSASYLREVLSLPVKPKLVIESVTYDRFQWLLGQEGQFAFLVGDPATDPTFVERAQEVEEIADNLAVKRVYWFNPNLSGNAKVGNITEPNLDIRNPSGITSIGSTSQAIYGRAWHNIVGRYLGNGVAVTLGSGSAAPYAGSPSITTAVSTTAAKDVVNDYGSTPGYSKKIVVDGSGHGDFDPNGGALYDYTNAPSNSASYTPPKVQDSYFFLYDKDVKVTLPDDSEKPSKIVAWVDLSEQSSSSSARAAITAVINKCGATSLKDIDEYSWWKSSTNRWQATSSPNAYQGANNPVITDADGDPANGGWRVHQITYPELVYLLKTETEKDVVVLFGGNWCPNTRPVLPFINRAAQKNGVTVFNFDTIIDGSVVGGGNSGTNPLQVRNPLQSGNARNPSFVYGDLVTQYLNNLKTQYAGGSRITYYPGGDATAPQASQQKLQVPYLFGYRGAPGDGPDDGVNRQWIYDKGDGTYTEYMSSWHWTNPQPDQLGISTSNVLRQTPIWATINSQLSTFTWQTDPATLKVNTGTDTDDAQFLIGTDKATVTSTGTPVTSVSVTSSTASGSIDINPTVLSAALTALGANAPANYTAARTALIDELNSSEVHAELRANLRTVVGAWGVAQSRKNTVNGIWGDAGSPGSVAGGLAAVHAADVFFDGLPSKPTPDPDPDDGNENPGNGNENPGNGGGSSNNNSQQTTTTPVVSASPTLTTRVASTKVAQIKASKVKGAVVKAPTRKKAGRYKVTIATPKGASTATGKVTIKLKKGKVTKTITGTLSHGVVTISVPKLARGTWKVTISWPGDSKYLTASVAGASIKVIK